jgi:hypothetical protein
VESKSDTKKIQIKEGRIKKLERSVRQKQLLIDFQYKPVVTLIEGAKGGKVGA